MQNRPYQQLPQLFEPPKEGADLTLLGQENNVWSENSSNLKGNELNMNSRGWQQGLKLPQIACSNVESFTSVCSYRTKGRHFSNILVETSGKWVREKWGDLV